jgi:hypothetical protein
MAETSGSITVSTKLGRMAACLLCVCCASFSFRFRCASELRPGGRKLNFRRPKRPGAPFRDGRVGFTVGLPCRLWSRVF